MVICNRRCPLALRLEEAAFSGQKNVHLCHYVSVLERVKRVLHSAVSSPVAWDEMVCVLLNAVLLNVVTCCLVVASAWGHRYLRQWIEYHMLAGAHKFFLASNEVCMHGRVHTTPSNARTRMRMAQ